MPVPIHRARRLTAFPLVSGTQAVAQGDYRYRIEVNARDEIGVLAKSYNDLARSFEPITVNIGINSGLASVGSTRFEGVSGTRWTYTATGSVTNLAARIGKVATQGEILIGEETAKRVEEHFPLQPIGERSLKNVSEQVPIYQVVVEERKVG
ncbi:MAG: adenylate/guanylate cyclase domain-containing protein [Candidatus Tectomicrobia bacterium]|nr:adenylate/guanylate cyclase domain-containing protein [Candidatus Tectomicrobia bacterium]